MAHSVDVARRLSTLLGAEEVWEVVGLYDVARRRYDGEMQDVTVRITYRAGTGFAVTAVATGASKMLETHNEDSTLDAALTTTRWKDLDN